MTAVSPEPTGSEVSLLHRISSIVSSELSIDEMLGEVLGFAVQVAECDACLVYLIDRACGEIVLRASQLPHAKALGKLKMKIGEGVTGWVAEHKSVVALGSNAGRDPRFKRFPTLIEDTYQAFISVPLVTGGEVSGVINAHYRQPREFTSEMIAMLAFIGEQMGSAVAKSALAEENLRLHEEAQEMKRQLETRKVVERAKGILMTRYSLTEEEAYLRLRNDSRRSRRAMRDLAQMIIQQEISTRQMEQSAPHAISIPGMPADLV